MQPIAPTPVNYSDSETIDSRLLDEFKEQKCRDQQQLVYRERCRPAFRIFSK